MIKTNHPFESNNINEFESKLCEFNSCLKISIFLIHLELISIFLITKLKRSNINLGKEVKQL